MKNNFGKFKKVPLFISIVFLILSVSVFAFLYRKIQSNNEISGQAEIQWQIENSKKDEIKSLNRLLKVIEVEKSLLDSHFIHSSDIVPFLDTIESLALQVQAKAEVTSVKISTDNTSLAVGVKAVGTFENLYKLLKLLENSPYQLEFTSFDIQRESGTTTPDIRGWSAIFGVKLLSFMQ